MRALESVSIFKRDLEPVWEDAEIQKGGEFRINIDNMETDDIKKLWENFVFDIIGGNFEFLDRVNE